MLRSASGIALALCLSALCGCGGDPYRLVAVSGRVTTCEGKPAAGGVVVFYPIDAPDETGRKAGNPGREARGTVGEDGTFTLTSIGIKPTPGAVMGRHRVVFEMPPTKRPTLSGEDRANMSPEDIKLAEADFASRPIYTLPPCSDQIEPKEVVVKAEDNNFELKLPPK